MRRHCESLRARNARMMALYFDQGWSLNAVAKAFGCSQASVRKAVRADRSMGRRRGKQGASPDPRRREDRKPLSPIHAFIGVRVAAHRRVLELNMSEFGLRASFSRFRVGQIESGAYDLSLGELHRIAAELGLTVSSLVSLAERPGPKRGVRR
jgi:transposase-like protein